MSECPFQSRLSAYHDRELDASTSLRLESHLAGCSACSEELMGIRAVSRLLHGADAGRMSQMGIARLHAVADDAAKKSRNLFPFAKTLLAAAASVLVIAGAWLTELPSHSQTTPLVVHPQPEAEWENVASGGKLQLPQNIANETDVATADWMVKSLKKKDAGS